VIQETLNRLARQFTARDIMVPRSRLVCGQDEAEARRKLKHHEDFNLIPIMENDRISGFLERDGNTPIRIDLHEHVISDSVACWICWISLLADHSASCSSTVTSRATFTFRTLTTVLGNFRRSLGIKSGLSSEGAHAWAATARSES